MDFSYFWRVFISISLFTFSIGLIVAMNAQPAKTIEPADYHKYQAWQDDAWIKTLFLRSVTSESDTPTRATSVGWANVYMVRDASTSTGDTGDIVVKINADTDGQGLDAKETILVDYSTL